MYAGKDDQNVSTEMSFLFTVGIKDPRIAHAGGHIYMLKKKGSIYSIVGFTNREDKKVGLPWRFGRCYLISGFQDLRTLAVY